MEKITCCEQCQLYWTCETKWYRGERSEENTCCEICDFYVECLTDKKQPKETKEATFQDEAPRAQ